MIYLFRFIFGYVQFSFSGGFKEDFLTECFANNYELRDICESENGFEACCSIKTYRGLHRIALKHGGVVRIIKKRGLPFKLLPLKNRIGFFVGMVCFCLIISFLCSFVWSVEVVGNNDISTASIISYLENNNLKSGVFWSSVDRNKLAWDMMSNFDNISWVHINKIGTKARVEINEVTKAPQGDEEKLKGINVFRKELTATASRNQKSLSLKYQKKYYNLKFFAVNIPLYINMKQGDFTGKKENMLIVKDTTLPIGIEKIEQSFFNSTEYELDDKQLEALARKKLKYLEQDEFDGFEIVNKAENVDITEDSCKITASYVIRRK